MTLQNKTILQIIPRMESGGAERTVIEIAQAIHEAGGKALVLSQGGALEYELRSVGGTHIAMNVASKNPFTIMANGCRIAKLVKDQKVDLMHVRSRAPAWSVFIASRRSKCDYISTYHGAYRQSNSFKAWYNSVMARGIKVIANSQFTADLVAKRYSLNDETIVVIPRGVPLERFDPSKVSAGDIAAKRAFWGLGSEDLIVLQPSRFTRLKGHSDVIDAAAHLHRDPAFANLRFVFIGDASRQGEHVAVLKEKISQAGLLEMFRFLGLESDMPTAIAAADLIIAPSVQPETFGRTIVEGLAMERPVVATNIGAPQEFLPRNDNGNLLGSKLVSPHAPKALATAISELLYQDRETLRNELQRARSIVVENYSTRALQDNNIRLYEKILDGVKS